MKIPRRLKSVDCRRNDKGKNHTADEGNNLFRRRKRTPFFIIYQSHKPVDFWGFYDIIDEISHQQKNDEQRRFCFGWRFKKGHEIDKREKKLI